MREDRGFRRLGVVVGSPDDWSIVPLRVDRSLGTGCLTAGRARASRVGPRMPAPRTRQNAPTADEAVVPRAPDTYLRRPTAAGTVSAVPGSRVAVTCIGGFVLERNERRPQRCPGHEAFHRR